MKQYMWLTIVGALLLAGPARAAAGDAKIPLPSIPQFNLLNQLLHVESTWYDGDIWYLRYLKSYPAPDGKTMRVSWWGRWGGEVLSDNKYFFPNLWTNNPDITALMADIGVPTKGTYSSSIMWERMNRIWYWMSDHTATDGDVYSTGIGFPSIADMAMAFRRNGVIQRGACMSTAQLMATLMARAGIPVNRIALAHAHYSATASHVYVLLLLPEGWYYLDPSDCPTVDQLPPYAERTSFGLHTCDYTHPFEVNILPGSNLNSVPLCLEAD